MASHRRSQLEGGGRGFRDAAMSVVSARRGQISRGDNAVGVAPERQIDAWSPPAVLPSMPPQQESQDLQRTWGEMSQGYLLNRIWADLGYHPSQARLFLKR